MASGTEKRAQHLDYLNDLNAGGCPAFKSFK